MNPRARVTVYLVLHEVFEGFEFETHLFHRRIGLCVRHRFWLKDGHHFLAKLEPYGMPGRFNASGDVTKTIGSAGPIAMVPTPSGNGHIIARNGQ